MESTRQFTFRLPESLIERVEACLGRVQGFGVPITRADVVRLLLQHALDNGACKDLTNLFAHPPRIKGATKKRS